MKGFCLFVAHAAVSFDAAPLFDVTHGELPSELPSLYTNLRSRQAGSADLSQ
ncbi:hypothetical protein BIFGAL_04213 [Bifidobacterium gallicum DSM 20093 = LMG 11596]|uniref:Uncharacterized protein n=1 Tax=Bifidobacterium gallicum DSM 20093 = LMG 11596 TaxID=561180 RepID=D1NWG3_9BIFI|nr:hypothetical protein BIFGAL_04213 [Bifidobacterium gallicum DSM 20093 = LMG 11596]